MTAPTKPCECQQETEQEKYARISQIIDEYKDKEGSLIQILHLAQGIYGYLPLELQQFIAQKLDIPLSKVSGVTASFLFCYQAERGIYDQSLSGNRLLCTRWQKDSRKNSRSFRASSWRDHCDWKIHPGSNALYWSLWVGSGHYYQ